MLTCENGSGQGQNRTADTRIFSAVLYRLSYLTTGSLQPERSTRAARHPAELTGFEPATFTLTG